MSDLGKNLDEQTAHALADRRFTQGIVLAVDAVSHTCTLDVGAVDVTGTPVYLHDVPYQAQLPPSVQDTVALVYANASPQSVAVSGLARGGQNAATVGTVAGVVTSLAVAGSAALQGPVLVAAGAGMVASEAGQTITIGNGGVLSLNALVGALNLAAGAHITITASGGNTLTIAAAAPGGTTDVEQVNNGIVGAAQSVGLLAVMLTGTTTSYSLVTGAGVGVWQLYNGTVGEASITCAAGGAFVGGGTSVHLPPSEQALFVSVYNGTSYDVYLLNSGIQVEALSSSVTLATAQVYDAAIHVDATAGAVTVTLPSPSVTLAPKYPFSVKKVDGSANNVTIMPPTGTIDGAGSRVLTAQWQSVTLYSDGSNYFVR